MYYWYEDNPNCGRCGHLNGQGFCNMTACLYPVTREDSTLVINPVTNYDRIISKTPEELAAVCADGCCRDIKCPDEFKNEDGLDCRGCWLDWLKQEAT